MRTKEQRRQNVAKRDQQYQTKPTFPICQNCQYFKFEEGFSPARINLSTWKVIEKKVKRKKRCKLGDFKVNERGTCACHEPLLYEEGLDEE